MAVSDIVCSSYLPIIALGKRTCGKLGLQGSFVHTRTRAVATGGGRGGGAEPPLEKFEPPLGCAVHFAVTIGIEVYSPPPEFCQPPPLLTIPGYGADSYKELSYIIFGCELQTRELWRGSMHILSENGQFFIINMFVRIGIRCLY